MKSLSVLIAASLALGVLPARAEAPVVAARGVATVDTVTVFAAASLKNALDEAAAAWKAKTGTEVKISYAASTPLAKQIEAGAPADIFVSADLASMDYLAERKLIVDSSRSNFLGNTLVVVAPKGSATTKLGFEKGAFETALGESGRIATGDPASVPVGKYARAALEKLGLWGDLQNRFAFADNVRNALNFAARDEAPLAIVYATDAASEPKVKVVATFPKDSHPAIVYPIALTKAAGPEAPAKFLKFLKSPAGTAAFAKQGFIILK